MKKSKSTPLSPTNKRADLAKRLIKACLAGDPTKVQRLIKEGADPNAFVKSWALRALPTAVRTGKIGVVKLLLAAGADPNGEDFGGGKPPGGTALENACRNGHLDIAALLIAKGADLNKSGYWPPLRVAVRNGHFEIVRLLLNRGVALDSSVLSYACENNNSREILTELIAAGADVNHRRTDSLTLNGATPLHKAAGWGDSAAVEVLLSAGAKVNVQTDYAKTTPLMSAAEAGNLQTVKALVAAGADIHLQDRSGKTAEKHARMFSRSEVAKFLRDLAKSAPSKKTKEQPVRKVTRTAPKKVAPKKLVIPRSQWAKKLPAVGASDFVDMVLDSGHPEWVVLAIEAPLAQVTKTYRQTFRVPECLESAPLKPAQDSDTNMAEGIPLVAPTGSNWTVIIRIMCYPVNTQEFEEAKQDAATLSKKLGARALTFLGEDTSGSMQCDLFKNGKPLGAECWLSQDDAADDLLKQLGVYIPACYARKTKEAAWLAVCPASQGKVKSAALIFD